MMWSRLGILVVVLLGLLTAASVSLDAQQQALNNADVIKMIQGGLGETIVLLAIKNAPSTAFDVSPDALIVLKSAGATEPIILEMLSKQDVRTAAPPVASRASAATASAPASIPVSPRSRVNYEQIQIETFDVRDGVIISDSYLDMLSTELGRLLAATKKFSKVFGPRTVQASVGVSARGDVASDSAGPTANLSGVITEFQGGNRAVRYLVGFGAGKTKVVAHVKLTDGATGVLLLEDDVDGKVIMGVAGGNSDGAATGLAKEVVKVVRRRLF